MTSSNRGKRLVTTVHTAWCWNNERSKLKWEHRNKWHVSGSTAFSVPLRFTTTEEHDLTTESAQILTQVVRSRPDYCRSLLESDPGLDVHTYTPHHQAFKLMAYILCPSLGSASELVPQKWDVCPLWENNLKSLFYFLLVLIFFVDHAEAKSSYNAC